MTADHLNSGEILCLELDDQALDDLITLLNENLQSIERKYEAAIEKKKLAQTKALIAPDNPDTQKNLMVATDTVEDLEEALARNQRLATLVENATPRSMDLVEDGKSPDGTNPEITKNQRAEAEVCLQFAKGLLERISCPESIRSEGGRTAIDFVARHHGKIDELAADLHEAVNACRRVIESCDASSAAPRSAYLEERALIKITLAKIAEILKQVAQAGEPCAMLRDFFDDCGVQHIPHSINWPRAFPNARYIPSLFAAASHRL